VLLLDEPLSNLDAKLREMVRVEIRELQRNLRITTVMVTHDQEEALIMADRLVVMSEGTVRQVGSQHDLYERPADAFVASFIGRSNLMPGAITAPGQFETRSGLRLKCRSAGLGPAVMSIRPEQMTFGAAAAALENSITGTVQLVSYLGASVDVHVSLATGDRILLSLSNRGDRGLPKEGDSIAVGWPAEAGVVLAGEEIPAH
jgi:putative spermidine/putrescine transport system ATP-binding protein